MKLVLDDFINNELKEYLLMQDGITEVSIDSREFLTVLNIKYNKKVVPETIFKHIELFQKNKFSILFEFDKGYDGDFKILKYVVKDMCCEYCYKSLVSDLFNNKQVKSVKSNFDFSKPAFNIEFTIEYFKKYDENELIKYIKKKL